MPRCPWTDADECSTARERSVAGTANPIPDCPIHGPFKEDTPIMRHAIVQGRDLTPEQLERYLPGNYRISAELPTPDSRTKAFMIEGQDDSGWTLSGYVIPRLASGLIGCQEVEA